MLLKVIITTIALVLGLRLHFRKKENCLFEVHKRKIQRELEINNLPRFVIGENEIINLYKKQNDVTEKQLKEVIKKPPNGVFFWIDDYVIGVESENKIGTLAHELCHVQQYEKNIFVLTMPKDEWCAKLKYLWDAREIDANRYAFSYCFKNCLYKEATRYFIILFLLFICEILFLIATYSSCSAAIRFFEL